MQIFTSRDLLKTSSLKIHERDHLSKQGRLEVGTLSRVIDSLPARIPNSYLLQLSYFLYVRSISLKRSNNPRLLHFLKLMLKLLPTRSKFCTKSKIRQVLKLAWAAWMAVWPTQIFTPVQAQDWPVTPRACSSSQWWDAAPSAI